MPHQGYKEIKALEAAVAELAARVEALEAPAPKKAAPKKPETPEN